MKKRQGDKATFGWCPRFFISANSGIFYADANYQTTHPLWLSAPRREKMENKELTKWEWTRARWYWHEKRSDGSQSFTDWLAEFKTMAELEAEMGEHTPELWE